MHSSGCEGDGRRDVSFVDKPIPSLSLSSPLSPLDDLAPDGPTDEFAVDVRLVYVEVGKGGGEGSEGKGIKFDRCSW